METEDEQCVEPTEEAKKQACRLLLGITDYYTPNLMLRLAAQALNEVGLISVEENVRIYERLPL